MKITFRITDIVGKIFLKLLFVAKYMRTDLAGLPPLQGPRRMLMSSKAITFCLSRFSPSNTT